MPHLFYIGFTKGFRLCRNVYYFEYRGIRFKLIQNIPKKRCDVILAIIPINDREAKNEAYIAASEFLSALAWTHHNMYLTIQDVYGKGIPDNCHLRNLRPNVTALSMVPFTGYLDKCDISRIPYVENDDQRNALILFREAICSNNCYLSFLFYWQILELGNNNAVNWVNKAYRRNTNLGLHGDIKRLPLKGKKLGNYFYDDCRNAISHISNRKKGKLHLSLDTLPENIRIRSSILAIKKLARYYIEDKLNLRKYLYLVRRGNRGFPIYVSDDIARRVPCRVAYGGSIRKAVKTLN